MIKTERNLRLVLYAGGRLSVLKVRSKICLSLMFDQGIKNSLKPTKFDLFGNGIIIFFNFSSWYIKINIKVNLKI